MSKLAQVGLLFYFYFDLRELFHHLFKGVLLESIRVEFAASDKGVLTIAREQNVVLPDHLTSSEDTLGITVDHVTFDANEDLARLLPLLVDDVILVEPHLLELLQVVQIEGIRTVLQKGHLIDRLLVQKSKQLNL